MKSYQLLSTVLFIAIAGSFSPLTGQDDLPPSTNPTPANELGDLAERVRAAKVYEISSEDIRLAELRVRRAMNRVENYLMPGGNQYVADWKKYLLWDNLVSEVGQETPDLRKLGQAGQRLFADHEGLERPEFLDLRKRLLTYVRWSQIAQRGEIGGLISPMFEEMALAIEAYEKQPSTENTARIGRAVGSLRAAAQVTDLATEVRREFAKPNLYFHIDKNLIAPAVAQPVCEATPVSETILCVPVTGQSVLQGNVSLEISQAIEHAALEIRLNGVSHNSNTAHARLNVHTVGQTEVSAVKRIIFDEHGLRSMPATVWANTNTQVAGVDAKLGLVRRIATSQAQDRLGHGNAVATASAKRRVAQNFDEQVDQQIADANARMKKELRAPLLRRDAYPAAVNFNTSNQFLHGNATQQNDFQLSTNTTPGVLNQSHLLTVWLHESWVRNLAESMLAGRTVDNEELAELMKDNSFVPPAGLESGEANDNWSITFPSVAPISCEFQDHIVRVTVAGQRWTRGDDALNELMKITASYRIVHTSPGFQLERVGKPKVESKGTGARQAAFRGFFAKRFDEMLPQTFEPEGFKLPEQLKGGRLMSKEVHANDGWLGIGWDRQ